MVLKIGELEVEIGANTTDLKKAGFEVKKTAKSMKSEFSSVGKTIAAAITIDAARRVVMIADNMRRLEGVVKRLTKTTGDFSKVWGELNKISDENGVAIEDSIGLFQRFQMALKNVTDQNGEVIDFIGTLQKIGRIGGSSTQEMGNALVQLSQGFSGGIIRAEEWNSIIEQAPEILNVVAKNMKGMNGDLGLLRKHMLAGKLTAESFYKSISDGAKDVDKEFAELPKTIDQTLVKLENSFSRFISGLDKTIGASSGIADFIDGLAESLQFLTAATADEAAITRMQELNGEIGRQVKLVERLQDSVGDSDPFGFGAGQIKLATDDLKKLRAEYSSLQKEFGTPGVSAAGGGSATGPAPVKATKVISVDDEIKRLNLLADIYNNKFAEIEADILSQRQKAIAIFGADSEEFLNIDKRLNAKRVTLRAEAEAEILEKSNESKQKQLDVEIDALEKAAKANEKLAEEASKAQIKAAEETARAFEQLNNKIGSELGSALTKTQSFSDAFKNIIADLAGQLIAAGITSAFGGTTGSSNIFSGIFSGATAGGNAFGGGVSPIASHRVNERGQPEMLEQAGKQFLLPNGKGGKVTPLKSGGGGGAPSITMINMGTPMNVESVNITEDGINVMINDKLAAYDKSLTGEMSKPNSTKSRALKNTFKLQQNLGR